MLIAPDIDCVILANKLNYVSRTRPVTSRNGKEHKEKEKFNLKIELLLVLLSITVLSVGNRLQLDSKQ